MSRKRSARPRPGDVYLDAIRTGKLPHTSIPLDPAVLKRKKEPPDSGPSGGRARVIPGERVPGARILAPTSEAVHPKFQVPSQWSTIPRGSEATAEPSVPRDRVLGGSLSSPPSSQGPPDGLGGPERRSRRAPRVKGAPPPPGIVETPPVFPRSLGKELVDSEPAAPHLGTPLGSATLCPLIGQPCLGPQCEWWDGLNACSLKSLLSKQSEIVGRLSSLINLLEYLGKELRGQ